MDTPQYASILDMEKERNNKDLAHHITSLTKLQLGLHNTDASRHHDKTDSQRGNTG